MLVIGQRNRTVKGQLKCHTCVSGQNMSCVCCSLTFHQVNCFFLNENVQLMSSFFFSNFAIVLINW